MLERVMRTWGTVGLGLVGVGTCVLILLLWLYPIRGVYYNEGVGLLQRPLFWEDMPANILVWRVDALLAVVIILAGLIACVVGIDRGNGRREGVIGVIVFLAGVVIACAMVYLFEFGNVGRFH